MFVCCECRVLSGRGLCDELITRPEESYRLCCVVVCDLETSRMGATCIYDISRLNVNTVLGKTSTAAYCRTFSRQLLPVRGKKCMIQAAITFLSKKEIGRGLHF